MSAPPFCFCFLAFRKSAASKSFSRQAGFCLLLYHTRAVIAECFTNQCRRAILKLMKKILITLLKPLSFLPALLMMYIIFSFSAEFLCVEKTYRIYFWTAAIVLMLLVNYKYEIFVQAPQVLRLENGGNAYVYHMHWQAVIPFLVEGGALSACGRMVYENRRENKFAGKSLRPVWYGIGALALGQICIAFPAFSGFPIDICSGIVMSVCVYYALYRKRLFRLNLLVSKANCYVAAFLISMLLFYSFIPDYNALLEKHFGFEETQLTMRFSFSMVLAAVVIYLIIKQPLIRYLKKMRSCSPEVSENSAAGFPT